MFGYLVSAVIAVLVFKVVDYLVIAVRLSVVFGYLVSAVIAVLVLIVFAYHGRAVMLYLCSLCLLIMVGLSCYTCVHFVCLSW